MKNFLAVLVIFMLTSCSKKEDLTELRSSLVGSWRGTYRLINGASYSLVQSYNQDGSIQEMYEATKWLGTYIVTRDSISVKSAVDIGEYYYATVKVNDGVLTGVRRGKDNKTVIGTYTLYKE